MFKTIKLFLISFVAIAASTVAICEAVFFRTTEDTSAQLNRIMRIGCLAIVRSLNSAFANTLITKQGQKLVNFRRSRHPNSLRMLMTLVSNSNNQLILVKKSGGRSGDECRIGKATARIRLYIITKRSRLDSCSS